MLLLGILLASPGLNGPWTIPVEHLVITTNVSLIALLVAVLVARAALQVRQYPTLLIALGFASMAGIFSLPRPLPPPGLPAAPQARGRPPLIVPSARVGASR